MMSDKEFIKTKLNEWKLSKWYDRFIEEDVDKDSFLKLTETEVSRIIPTIGGTCRFLENRKLWLNSVKSKCHEQSKQTRLPKFSSDESTSTSTSHFNKDFPNDEILNTTVNDDVYSENDSHDTANVHSSDISTIDEETTNSTLRKCGAIKKSTAETKNQSTGNKNVCPNNSARVKDTDLKKLLLNSLDGVIIQQFYEKHKILNECNRRKLTEILITHFMFQKFENTTEINRLGKDDFHILSQKIIELFPNERQAIYYVPKPAGTSRKRPTGKFVFFHINKISECRQIGLFLGRQTKIEIIDNSVFQSSICPTRNHVQNTLYKTQLRWLQHNISPWSSVEEHWNKFRELRYIFINEHEGNILKIFNEYPALKEELGYTLLENDYNALINEKSNIYYGWPELSKKLEVLLARRFVEDKTFATRLEEIQLYEQGNACRDAALLSLIPVLCPSNVGLKIPQKKIIRRPTIAESMDAFIYHIKIPEELEKVKSRKRKDAAKLKATVQPYIIVVGPQFTAIDAFYIIINDVTYSMENILKAVDILYKVFQVLKMEYPTDCKQVWLFLQKYIYGHRRKCDKNDKSVMNLIDELKRVCV